jgi:hypothetical protein
MMSASTGRSTSMDEPFISGGSSASESTVFFSFLVCEDGKGAWEVTFFGVKGLNAGSR